MSITTIIEDASIVPMSSRGARAEAIAFRNGRVVAVGPVERVREAAGEGARTVRLPGKAVLPGWIDAHHHFMQSVVYGSSVELAEARNHDELLSALKDRAASTPPGEWIIGFGYDPTTLTERRAPTRRQLDEACPEHPLLAIEYSFHDGVANSIGLATAGFTDSSPALGNGAAERNSRGELTGRLSEAALFAAESVARESLLVQDTDAILERLGPFQERLFECGITSVCEPGVPPQSEALLRRALSEGKLRMPLVIMPLGRGGFAGPLDDRLGGTVTGEGTHALRVGPVKIVLDGATRCAMCVSLSQVVFGALSTAKRAVTTRSLAPIRATLDIQLQFGADLRLRTGTRYHTPSESENIVRKATDHGFAVALHAIGNDAVEQALDAIAKSRDRHKDKPPPRIEHGTAITPELARRAADLGVAIVTQPDFLRFPVFEMLPPPSGFRYWASKTLRDARALVAFSSDAPVTGFDPLDGIRSAVRRRAASGRVFQGDEAVDVWEAVESYTRNAAEACGTLAETGTLEVGKRADFIVLNRDPTLNGLDALDNLRVDATYLAGECVFSRKS